MKLLLLLLGVTCFGCHKPDEDVLRNAQGVVTKVPYVWKSSVSLDGGLTTTMHAQHIYKEQYLLTAQRVTQTQTTPVADNLCFKDVQTGENKWVWSDRSFPYETATLFKNYIYSHQNLLVYNYGPRAYCIDQETGKTVWRQEWTPGLNHAATTAGYGEHFYFTGTPPDLWQQKRWEEYVYQGDMRTGQVRPIAKLAILPGKVWTDPSGLALYASGSSLRFFVRGSDTLMLVSYELPVPRPQYNATTSGYLSLYNLTQKAWVYEQVPVVNDDELGVCNLGIIEGDKVYYTVALSVGCFEIMTGKRVWLKRLTDASLFSDLMLVDGKLLANGQNAKLYAVDPATGTTLWTQESSAIGSNLYQQNGVVYYIASQKLLAVEIATGKLLWKLDCPDDYTEKRTDSWFSGFVTGTAGQNGQKSRIFAGTNLNVYCFEAIQ